MAEPVQETSNQINKPGVYRHPETGAEVVARQHPKYGSAQADGFARVGFEYVGPAPVEEKTQKVGKK